MAASDMRSPGRPTLHDRLGILSSSPSFPDLQDLIAIKTKAKPQLMRSGSAAAPIPANASTTFTSASDLLRVARAIGDDSFDVIDEPDPPVAKKAAVKRVRKNVKGSNAPADANAAKTAKSAKRVAKDVIILSSDGATPELGRNVDALAAETVTPHPVDADDGQVSERGTPLQAKPWKKFKAPSSPRLKEAEEAGTAPAKLSAKAKSLKKKSQSETVSRNFSKEKQPEVIESEKFEAKRRRPRACTPEATNLEPAVQRRVDWTPAKPDTVVPESSPDSFEKKEAFASTLLGETGPGASDLFKNLRDTYGHKGMNASVAAAPEQPTAQILGKRKAIDMVSVNVSSKPTEASRAPSPGKQKAPKKKPRTITELATAAYVKFAEDDGGRDDSLLEYFTVGDPEQDVSKGSTIKGKGKASKVTKSKKKAPPKKPVLLSPQSAMRQSAAQDFVFGTSSQLAREKSPTFLKDLHAAMKASTIAEEAELLASPLNRVEPRVRGRGLWSVSARDEEGDVVNVDIIDMIDSPALPQDDAILDPWRQLPPEPGSAETETADSSVIELGSGPNATSKNGSSQPPVPKSRFFMTQKMTLNAAAAMSPTQSSDESFPLVAELLEDEMPPPSNQQQTQEEVRDSPDKATASAQKPRPKYETFTDVKLAKEISKFGFKAVKTRTGMIALLDQCWKRKSQVSMAGAAFSTSSVLASPKRKQTDENDEIRTNSPSPAKKLRGKAKKTADADSNVTRALTEELHIPPKKKPGRPRKDAVAAAKTVSSMPPPSRSNAGPSTPKRKRAATRAELVVEEFDVDSEIEASASSPERLFSPSGGDVDITIGEDTEISLNLSPTAQQSILFSHITKAITSAPRTTDPDNPSWHERMLMYDPIILEDLTAWLNSGELTKLGYDDEVSPQDVKKWCELRSICCLWKGNWHGKERKRF